MRKGDFKENNPVFSRIGSIIEIPVFTAIIFSVTRKKEKKTLKAAAVCNLVVGVGLVTAGILFPSKSCALLGGVSVISSIVLRKESKNKTHES